MSKTLRRGAVGATLDSELEKFIDIHLNGWAKSYHEFKPHDRTGTQCGLCWGWRDDPRHYWPPPFPPRARHGEKNEKRERAV